MSQTLHESTQPARVFLNFAEKAAWDSELCPVYTHPWGGLGAHPSPTCHSAGSSCGQASSPPSFAGIVPPWKSCVYTCLCVLVGWLICSWTYSFFSVIHIYILYQIRFLYRLVEYTSLCYTVGPCCLSILYTVCVYVNPKLLSYPSPASPLVTISLFSMSVGLFLKNNAFYTYNWITLLYTWNIVNQLYFN